MLHDLNHLSSRSIINKNTIYIRPRILATLFVRLFSLYPVCNILADAQWRPHPLAGIAICLRGEPPRAMRRQTSFLAGLAYCSLHFFLVCL